MQPNHDMEVKTIGLRPGEKLHEELITESDERVRLDNERMFRVCEPGLDRERFVVELETLRGRLRQRDADGCLEQLQRMTRMTVPEVSTR